jgi:hypothetical protein
MSRLLVVGAGADAGADVSATTDVLETLVSRTAQQLCHWLVDPGEGHRFAQGSPAGGGANVER